MFVTVSHLLPIPIFVGKAVAYSNEALMELHSKGRLLTSPAKIELREVTARDEHSNLFKKHFSIFPSCSQAFNSKFTRSFCKVDHLKAMQ